MEIDMTEQDAILWGEDEARAAIAAYYADLEDGYTNAEAWQSLIDRRNRAACYIDVPRAWRAYRDALLTEFPGMAEFAAAEVAAFRLEG